VDVHIETLALVDDDDAAAISRLVAQMSSRTVEVQPDRVRQVATDDRSCIVVARVDGRVVATATLLTMQTLVGTFGYVEEVAVDADLRGRGIGHALMVAVLSTARDRGHDFVELTSRPSREAANALYRSLGFTLRETNVYRFDLR